MSNSTTPATYASYWGSRSPAEIEAALLADLVSAVGISQRAKVVLNTVSVWQRRYPDFPKPLEAPGVDRKLWRWSEVEAWREGRKRA
jgi:hypothetical protein